MHLTLAALRCLQPWSVIFHCLTSHASLTMDQSCWYLNERSHYGKSHYYGLILIFDIPREVNFSVAIKYGLCVAKKHTGLVFRVAFMITISSSRHLSIRQIGLSFIFVNSYHCTHLARIKVLKISSSHDITQKIQRINNIYMEPINSGCHTPSISLRYSKIT